jgi:ABC-2 type transport system ATP-binding protein
MLKVTDFSKSYNGQLILEVPVLHVVEGLHWLKGSNGSGKTTFFRSVAGMLPFDGSIVLGGQYNVRRQAVAYRLRVNYGEAEPLYPAFVSAHDLIHFVGKAKRATPAQINELVERLEIGHFWRNPTGTYSSGMLKKTSLVLAFLGNPTLMMLDEPLITIDERAVDQLYALIQEKLAEGVTFLLSSHQDVRSVGLPLTSSWIVKDKTIQAL